MKKGKLLLLFVLILSLSALAVACTGDSEVGAEPKQVDHEMHDYLVYEDEDAAVFTEVKQLEGECVSLDAENRMAVMKEVDVDVLNNLVEKYKVYDLVSGEIIFEAENASPYFAYGIPAGEEKTTLEVSIEYPVICEKRTTVSVSEALGEDTTYKIAYYAAKKDGELIHETEDENFHNVRVARGENLYSVELGDKIFWIDHELKIVRSVETIYAGGYDTDGFEAEYQGYLYSWTENRLYVFNHKGLCSATYSAADDSYIQCFVLNNGNVLLQEHREVDIHEEYDYLLDGDRMVLTTYIIDAVTGEAVEQNFNYIVTDLESAYTEDAIDTDHSYYGRYQRGRFELAEGKQNKAIVIKIANGSIAKSMDYVVIDNELNIEYRVRNENPDVEFNIDLWAFGPNMYGARIATAGKAAVHVFDLDGNPVCAFSGMPSYITDRYLVTDNVIYDLKMNVVYDAAANGYKISNVSEEKVFLTKLNFITAGHELYEFDVDKKEPKLISDGKETMFVEAVGGCYVLVNMETEVFTVYAADSTEIFAAAGFPMIEYADDDIMIIKSEFSGKMLTYVVK